MEFRPTVRSARAIALALALHWICVPVIAGCKSSESIPLLTGDELAKRCQGAYAALDSYSGTTTVVTSGTVGGTPCKFETSARIQFVRPRKVRIEGNTMVPNVNFSIVSDGERTWATSIADPEKWERAESIEMAIGAFTGVSGMAVTTIASILIDSDFGNSIWLLSGAKVALETIEGRLVYRANVSTASQDVTYWIDAESFLLVRRRTLGSYSNIDALQLAPGIELPKSLAGATFEFAEVFEKIRTNESIPNSAFSLPNSARAQIQR